jgi:hypothetical protein
MLPKVGDLVMMANGDSDLIIGVITKHNEFWREYVVEWCSNEFHVPRLYRLATLQPYLTLFKRYKEANHL